jgi:hypothetical protein
LLGVNEWRVASGEWRVASGEWRVASGEWEENPSKKDSGMCSRRFNTEDTEEEHRARREIQDGGSNRAGSILTALHGRASFIR